MINIAAVSLDKPKEVFSEVLKTSSKVLMDLSLEFFPFAGGISILNIHQFYSVKDEDTVSNLSFLHVYSSFPPHTLPFRAKIIVVSNGQ